MSRVLLWVAITTAVLGTSAQAATRHKHDAARVPHLAAQTSAPVQRAPRVGPVWAGPNECFSDEGYGRWMSCGGGRGY
jgi:hypothetical protein